MCYSGFTSLWFLLSPSFDLFLFSGPICPNAHILVFSYKHPSIYLYHLYIYQYHLYLIFMCVWKCPSSLCSHYQLSQRALLWGEAKRVEPFSCSPHHPCLPPPLWLPGWRHRCQLRQGFALMASGSLAHTTDICVGSCATAPGAVNGLVG